LGTGKTTGQNLADNHRSLIGLLTGRRQTLDCTQHLCHPLRLIRKQKSDLGTDHLARRLAMRGPLLARNRATPTLEDKLVQVLPPHKLGDLTPKLNLAIPQGLDLRLESADLIIDANPTAQSLADLVSHLFICSSDI
jgi:hypothetical protein